MGRIKVVTSLPVAIGPELQFVQAMWGVQADIYVRFQRLRGQECLFLSACRRIDRPWPKKCGHDWNVPELYQFEPAGLLSDFGAIGVEFDGFGNPCTAEHRDIFESCLAEAESRGRLREESVATRFCTQGGLALDDRMVRWKCPHCGTQLDDDCVHASGTLMGSPSCCLASRQENDEFRAVQPECAVCGAPADMKSAPVLVFDREKPSDRLAEWNESRAGTKALLQGFAWYVSLSDVAPFVLTEPGPRPHSVPVRRLKTAVSRANVDSIIGYLTASARWTAERSLQLADLWSDPAVELTQFRPLSYPFAEFTYLSDLWPSMLDAMGFVLPSRFVPHPLLNLRREGVPGLRFNMPISQMFGSVEPDLLRLASVVLIGKQTHGAVDVSPDRLATCSSQLTTWLQTVGSWPLFLINKAGPTRNSMPNGDETLLNRTRATAEKVADAYDRCCYADVLHEIDCLHRAAQIFVNNKLPTGRSIVGSEQQTVRDCVVLLNVCRSLLIMLKPIMPKFVARIETVLGFQTDSWSQIDELFTGPFPAAPAEPGWINPKCDQVCLDALFQATIAAERCDRNDPH